MAATWPLRLLPGLVARLRLATMQCASTVTQFHFSVPMSVQFNRCINAKDVAKKTFLKGKEINAAVVQWVEESLQVKLAFMSVSAQGKGREELFLPPPPPEYNVDWQYFVRAGTPAIHHNIA